LTTRPPIAPIQPHTIRDFPLNTPAKRLFSDVASVHDPDLPIPSVEDFSRLSSIQTPIQTPTPPGAFPRSSSVPIHHSFTRSSSPDPITMVQSPLYTTQSTSSSSINPIKQTASPDLIQIQITYPPELID
jgi:hypothetical protein